MKPVKLFGSRWAEQPRRTKDAYATRPESAAWGWRSAGESRWPATLAILIAVVLQIVLPSRLVFGPRYLLPIVEALLLVVLIIANPAKLDHLSRDMRWVSLTLIVVLTGANLVNLSLLMNLMLKGDLSNGRELIRAAVGIWATNMLAFSLWYWELDRGGPIARCQEVRREPDLYFPQMDAPNAARPGWTPKFLDYVYVSLTNSLAFSPTDTMPMSISAKCLMGAESLISIATVVVVGARAVNILS